MKNKKKHSRVKRFFKIFGLVIIGLMLLGFVYEKVSEYIDSKTITPPGQMVEVNGHEMHIYCTGENINGNPTIVMIPGAGSAYFTFDKIQPTLSQYTKVCSYDPSGFGFSEGAKDGRTAQDVAKELSELLVKAKINGPYLVVGHSLGGIYAQVFAKNNVDSVKSMVLVDSSCIEQADIKEPEPPLFVKIINGMITNSSYFGLPRLVVTLSPDFLGVHQDNLKIERSIVAKPMKETNSTSIIKGALNSVEQLRNASYFGDLPIIILEADGSQKMATETWGSTMGECHKKMVSFSTNAKYVLVKNSEHSIQDDQPQAVIDQIKSLIK